MSYAVITFALGAITLGSFSWYMGSKLSAPATHYYESGFDAFWELDFFGRIRRNVEANSALVQAAEASVYATQVSVTGRHIRFRSALYDSGMNQAPIASKRRRYKYFAYVAAALVLGAAALGAFSWYMGGKLSASANHPIGGVPESLVALEVSFPSESGSTIHGWISAGVPGQGAVLLLHGVRSDRRSMVSRAVFLRKLGYSVLLIDLQAHGESPGERITLGHLESRDVIAARAFLKANLPRERVAAIGVSLGAAAIVLADGQAQFDAVVLESMYPTITEAVRDRLRLRLGAAGTLLEPLLTMQLEPRLGIDVDQLRPIDHISALRAPLLLIHGTQDQHTLIDEARAIYARASEPKKLWEIPKAAHVDLHRFAGAEYERRVDEFIGRHLRVNMRSRSHQNNSSTGTNPPFAGM